MKKQVILLSLFLVYSLFSNPIQAANLDDLEICPNSYLRSDHAFYSSSKRVSPFRRIKPLPKEALPENEALKEGDSCKVATVETRTRPGSDRGYEGGGYVQWTLVKKEDNKEVWAAHTEWGLIYVGDIEDGTYTFFEAKWLCRDKEIVINGEKIKMTLLERPGVDIERPAINVELLTHLNTKSVVLDRYEAQPWFWSNFGHIYRPWDYPGGSPYNFVNSTYYKFSVRCVGRKAEPEPQCGCE